MFCNLGVPIAPRKTVGPTQIIEFIGIVLASIKLEARLLKDKVEHIKEAFPSGNARRHAPLRNYIHLLGPLILHVK